MKKETKAGTAICDAVIVGAGPYGLSVAAYLRQLGVNFRIFGKPMASWSSHMPTGMRLKSEGNASDIYDPEGKLTLKKFCAERGIHYADTGVPIHLDTFINYGLTFAERLVPNLENKLVDSIERVAEGFRVRLEDGEVVTTRCVVMAIGISYFSFIPENFSGVPRDLLSHASHHTDLGKFRGKKVVVLGGGSSAMDMAGLLRDQGVDVTMVCRRPKLKFPPKPSGRPRSFWQKLRHPPSGLGDGLRRRFLANCPIGFHYFPEQIRLYTVQRSLGPAGGWFSKDMVVGRVPVLTGSKIESIDSKQGLAQLRVRQTDGTVHELVVDHVIAATGYRVAIARLDLLSNDIRKKLKSVNDTPILSSRFESSVPGLYFVGVSAANSFGPVMRFACGAQFTAERVSRGVANSVRRKSQ